MLLLKKKEKESLDRDTRDGRTDIRKLVVRREARGGG